MIHTENFRTGLIGRKLSHSFSPEIHSYLADYEYKLYEMEEEDVGRFLKNCPLDALNVTIPYKKTVMPFLSHISETALKIGSVNTIVKKPDGLYGYNTDYYGFSYMVNVSGIEIKGKKVLVLGSGGASLTVIAVLSDMGAGEIVNISRSGENNYGNIYLHKDADVIVNTTPVGMYPDNGVSPVDLRIFTRLSGVLDLIYNPSVTKLIYDAEKLGIPAINGLSMLSAQAKRACELFLGQDIEKDPTPDIVKSIEQRLKNIVLVGMPGCGKSTAGRLLSEKLQRKFIDTDEMIVRSSEMPIPEIFSSFGEDEFRRRETEAAKEAGKASGAVISTGGGIITREENYYPLHQNSYIIWLKRDTSLLPVDGRPISQTNDINELYRKRAPLYESFCDGIIEVSENAEETVQRIIDTIRRM
ncbi:MAG: shikimate kinase [Clostridia bacterium]|nr:shikimate kinase [Clostridia bacterium]